MNANTIPAMFIEVCEQFADQPAKTAYANKYGGTWQHLSHNELRDRVECFAIGLLRLGIQKGDRVGIVSENRPEWVIADFAITSIGAVDVPVFYTLTANQLAYIFNDCQVVAIIVSTVLQAEKIASVRNLIPSVRTVIVMNEGVNETENTLRFNTVTSIGEKECTAIERRRRIAELTHCIQPNDLLTLIYTSGTTGVPKGVMLSHKNILSNINAAVSVFTITSDDVFLSYLPMCHSYERMSGYYLAFSSGCTTFIAESIESVAENMKEVHPTVMTSVPRLFERIRSRIKQNIDKAPPLKRMLGKWAMKLGFRVATETGTWLDRLMLRIADALVFAKIRARMGNRLRFFMSGGATLNTDDAYFFKAIGVTILEGYGLTETSPVLTVNREGDEHIGTVGKPLPNVELMIDESGEILARGPNIMMGYWNDQAATDEMIDNDGWLHTGDIGTIDSESRLRITDRKKAIFVSSGGKNIAPQPIETALLASDFIHQVVLVGEGRDYCVALIVPEIQNLEEFALRNQISYQSIGELLTHNSVIQKFQSELNRHQIQFAKFERARRFHLIEVPFTVENNLLTPTLKVRRNAVCDYYKHQINEMYREPYRRQHALKSTGGGI